MSTVAMGAAYPREEVRAITAADWGMLILRLALGGIMAAHGAQKLFGWFGGQGMDKVVAGFANMGMPVWVAWMAGFIEFFGGVALVAGILARLAALGIFCQMVVAIMQVHLKYGLFMNWFGNQKGEGFEYHILVLAMCVAIMLIGPRRIAIADVERRWV